MWGLGGEGEEALSPDVKNAIFETTMFLLCAGECFRCVLLQSRFV